MQLQPTKCTHCFGRHVDHNHEQERGNGWCKCNTCMRAKDDILRTEDAYRYGKVICSVCNGTGWVLPNQHVSISLPIVSAANVSDLRGYIELLREAVELQRDMLNLRNQND